jgi:outer membrane murein-binding lipoprotein Lpp
VNNKTDHLAGEVATIKEDVTTLREDVATLKRDVAGIKDDVAAIKTMFEIHLREHHGIR